MLANFLIFGILLAISNQRAAREASGRRTVPQAGASPGMGAGRCCAPRLLGFAAYYQVAHDREFLARDAKVFEDDGVKRAATQSAAQFAGARDPARQHFRPQWHSARYQRLERTGAASRSDIRSSGVSIDTACSRLDNRHYPFGALTAHLLGDLRTGDNFHATNASLIEHDSNVKLQGFTDYRELAPLIRYRHQPGNPEIAKLMARDRNVTASIDIRLQMRAEKALEDRLAKAHKDKGAVVVMDPNSRRRAGAGERAGARARTISPPRRTNCSIARATANIRRARPSSW